MGGMPSRGGPPERISLQLTLDLLKSVVAQPSAFQRAGSAMAPTAQDQSIARIAKTRIMTASPSL